MNNRWAALVAASLVAFASLVITWQFRHYDGVQIEPYSSLAQSVLRGEKLAKIPIIVARSQEYVTGSGTCRYYDLVLPANARIFMTDMTGPTNYDKIGYYFYMIYYLFPREIGVSIDQPTRMTENGFAGRTAESDQEILDHGFNVRFSISPDSGLHVKALEDLSMRFPANPPGFNTNYETAMAFLLPLLTMLAGMWLFRFLFPALNGQMPLPEQLAYGLGLGMMAVAAITLGVKLCGFHGRGLVLVVTAAGSLAELWRNRKIYLAGMIDGGRKLVRRPVGMVFWVTGAVVFLILFRLAGLQGLTDGDAMRWMLKAKMLYLYTGKELVQWFSSPHLAYAHLDYPTLLPALHAATYDSLGHVDEFVTKFWHTWMLLLLIGALASLYRGGRSWFPVPSLVLLGLLLLPAVQLYVQWEGSTLPMIFFTVLGFVQCALWLVEKDRARLGLGLTLLFGAAMTKLEGFIFLALVGSWMLLLPSARPSLKLSPRVWRVLAFGLLAALPFLCLRVQIPALNYESGWTGYAARSPGTALSIWPGIFLIQVVRFFVNADFACWSGEGGRFHWIGRWDGFSSLYNHSTLGLAWLCLWLTVALWFAVPGRRRVVLWALAMLVSATAILSGVFVSFIGIKDLTYVLSLTNDVAGGRYLLPVLLAWFVTLMTLFFAALPLFASTPVPKASVTKPRAAASTAAGDLPGLKDSHWLAAGALLIVVLGVFVLPKNEPALPKNPPPSTVAANPLNVAEINTPENSGLQTRMELAGQLNQAGKFAEALQEYREAARLYPNDPMALNNLAWSLAANHRQELRNGKEAVQLARKAVELTDQQMPVFIGTLAAAYAEDGQFAKAIETAEKARNLALLRCQMNVAVANDQLLKRYAAGKAVGLENGP